MTYVLTNLGKKLLWKDWEEMGGNSISNHETPFVTSAIGPINTWIKNNISLGNIAKISKIAERELARFAYNNFPTLNLSKKENYHDFV